MSAADGSVIGLTKIFDSGTPGTRWNLVVVAEGYQAIELAQFAADAQAVVDRLITIPPFDRPEIQCGINVYRLDVSSNESGADKPNCADGGGNATSAATYFDATFCADGQTQRLLSGDSTLARETVEDWLPEWDQIIVVCNDPERGGAGGQIAWTSNSSWDWKEVAIHELGHSVFGLADEYDYGGPDVYAGGEPGEPNVTLESNPAACKWSALVTAGAGDPTRANPDCSTTDPGPNPVAAGTVGTFEGAKYSHCGCYRPVWTCMMRDTSQPFCPVCTDTIVEVMSAYNQPAPSGDVNLATSTVDFNDVPTSLSVVRAARFDVNSCVGVSFQVLNLPAAPFALESLSVVNASPAGPSPWRAYVWFRLDAGAAGPVLSQQVTIRCLQTGEDFVVTLSGNVVERPSVATQLVFDRSGSMLDTTDEGRTKEQVLKDSATAFVDLMWDDNGIGINAYDQDPHPIMDVAVASAPGEGGGRDAALDAIADHVSNPAGMTAIGDGIELARSQLDAAAGSWDSKAMIVLTDGIETANKTIAEVADAVVDNRVFAIGMGTAEQIQPAALDTLTSGTGGYLLMTGLIGTDETFLLEKYYVQILAGVNNNDIVVDPEGWARPGVIDRVPFDVTASDVEITAMVLGRPASALIMALEAPDGQVVPIGHGSVTGRTAGRTMYMRAGLPLLVGGVPAHAGRWHLLLTVNLRDFGKTPGATPHTHGSATAWAITPDVVGIRYSASVAAYSNLRMAVALHQNSREPGAALTLVATLTEYGAPFLGHATVQVDLTRPDGSLTRVVLHAVSGEPGRYEAHRNATQAGIYRAHFLAAGRTTRDQPFTREALRTAAVWHGGDQTGTGPFPGGTGSDGGSGGSGSDGGSGGSGPGGGSGGGNGGGRPELCELLECLAAGGVFSPAAVKRLQQAGVDLSRLRDCLQRWCRERPTGGAEAPQGGDGCGCGCGCRGGARGAGRR